jgi:hypothetical protein
VIVDVTHGANAFEAIRECSWINPIAPASVFGVNPASRPTTNDADDTRYDDDNNGYQFQLLRQPLFV